MTYFPIKDLKRADYNPRVMAEKEMDALVLSIATHGFVEPIVVNINKDRYGVIVGGHQRLTAIEKLIAKGVAPKGLKSEKIGEGIAGIPVYETSVPVFEVDLTLEAEKQLNIGLNKIHGAFEEDKLFEIISSMQHSPTLLSTGFDSGEIAQILGIEGEGSAPKDAVSHDGCARCAELKASVEGHGRRTKHVISFNQDGK